MNKTKGCLIANFATVPIQVGGHPIRACFAFDPIRRGIVLCAGDKKGKDETRFYKKLIKMADAEYAAHLLEQEK